MPDQYLLFTIGSSLIPKQCNDSHDSIYSHVDYCKSGNIRELYFRKYSRILFFRGSVACCVLVTNSKIRK